MTAPITRPNHSKPSCASGGIHTWHLDEMAVLIEADDSGSGGRSTTRARFSRSPCTTALGWQSSGYRFRKRRSSITSSPRPTLTPQRGQTPCAPCAELQAAVCHTAAGSRLLCFVLGRRNWNSATLAVLNQHLAITGQVQTLRHAIPPVCASVQILETWRECEQWHFRRER
jgi:hypothetical protein